jgi:hypothetical protein
VLKIIIWILLSLGLGGAITVAAEHDFFRDHHPWHKGTGHPVAAPEIDPAGAMGGLTLLLGGLAVLRGRGLKQQP